MRLPEYSAEEILDLLDHFHYGLTVPQMVELLTGDIPDYAKHAHRNKILKRLEREQAYGFVEKFHPCINCAMWRLTA